LAGIITETFPGAPGGMNLALPAQELDDTEARYIQDGLVDYPARIRRRGPVKGALGVATFSRKGSGFVVTLNPQGATRYAVLTGNAANGYFSVLSDDKSAIVDLAWPNALPTDPSAEATAYRYVDAKAALTGGTLVGVTNVYDIGSVEQGIAYWRGGNKANYTVNVTVTRGSATVTGTGFDTNVSPGMWLFANTDEGYTSTLIGCVKQINSGTQLTLTNVSPYAITALSGTFQSIRGLYPKVMTGRITCATDSTTVSGGATKFQSQGLNSGTWQIYRASDMAYVGKVSAVTSEISLTLTANAAIAMADEKYVALKADGDWSINNLSNSSKVGFLSAVYAERQWYANCGAQHEKTFRVWFSDPADPEALDVTADGDWIEISSTTMVNQPIRALVPAYNSLVVLKEDEAFAIHGSSRESFSVKKIHDDGVLSGMSVQPYGGGAIWAGRDGIHFYDGIQVHNLTAAKLGDVWKNSVRSFDPDRYRMYSMIARDHYILFIEDLDPTIPVIKGNVSSTPSRWTILINMVTQAVTMATNLNIRGAVQLPASEGKQVWYIANDSTKVRVCDTDDLFDSEGVDAFACDGGTTGPDFFFESKKFNAGDAMRLKRFRQLAVHYLVAGGSIKCDVVLGLNNIGSTLLTEFVSSVPTWETISQTYTTWDALKAAFATWDDIVEAVYVPKRARFSKKSQHIHFRLYQSSSAIDRLTLGPYGITYKLLRPGRV